MPQIKFPTEFLQQVSLQGSIITKNNEPGFDSPLTDWMAENGIDLEADEEAAADALALENERASQTAASITGNKNRDNLFSPVFTFIRKAVQALKKYYMANPSVLRDWGIPITDSGRINYPSSFEERTAIATLFFEKLATFAEGTSPLAAFLKTNKVNVVLLTGNNTSAAKANATAVKAAKAAEDATEKRDLRWKDALAHIHMIGDYLKSINPDNPRALGEWGFVVDESVLVRKERKVKLGLGEMRVVDSIRIGSIVTNMSQGDVLLYKGKDSSGKAAVLQPNSKMGMIKGYSTITLVNPSTLEMATVLIQAPE